MTSACNKYAIDIISLRRPTALDKLADTIPKPKGAIPNFGLPKWKEMPLESKIPMVPGPAGAYNFTRRKIGKRLWIAAADAEFNLSDPYCYEIEFTYDSLHDKHLIPYFSRPNILRSLIKAGLVTENLDAKCSLRDYNMFRKYLRRLHCDSIKKELYRQDKWDAEEKAIQYAQDQAEKEVRNLKNRERLMEKRRSIVRHRALAEKQKHLQQLEKQQKIKERIEALMLRRREEQYVLQGQIKARAEEIQQKQRLAADIEREKITQTLMEWKRKERIRKKKREMRLAHEQEERRRIVEEKWQERQNFQRKQIKKEQFLMECIENQRAKFKAEYSAKVEKEARRMQKLLIHAKMYVKCSLARRVLTGNKERICCKKYMPQDEEDLQEMVASMRFDRRKYLSKFTSDTYSSSPGRKSARGKTALIDKLKHGKDARKKKMGKTSTKVKGKSSKGGKRKKGKGKRKKRRRKRKDEADEKSETEEVQEESITKDTETSEEGSETEEKCRCKAIHDMKKAKTDNVVMKKN